MKRLFCFCIVILLLTACGQTTIGPSEPSSAAVPTTVELTSAEEPSTEDPAPSINREAQFTVTEHQLFPPPQVFDAEFEAFYKEFTTAVRRKDMRFIDSILDDGIMSSFGGEPNKEFFHEHWEIRKQHYGQDLWDVLAEMIALGGVYYQAGEFRQTNRGKCFVAPYVFGYDPGEAYEFYAVIDKGVSVYENESINSKVIDTLDYNILEFHYSQEFWEKKADDFVSVTTLSGAAGFIQRKHLRSPIDYRLCIEQKDGAWKLLWLIAGD